jgi:DNA-binding CsgD family transcriptional regulator
MTREEAHHFLLDLLGHCVPKGQIDRVAQFYTEDVIGYFCGETFNFNDLKERIRLLGENITDHHLEIIDFMQFDAFILVVSRQHWRHKNDGKLIEVVMSVVYRMRENRICELWVVWDTKTDHFSATNQHFPESLKHLVLEEKDKAEFIRYINAYPYCENGHPVGLSSPQQECLYYYLTGLTAKEIGKIKNLSPRTVEDYLEAIKSKYNCSTKSELRKKVFH